MESSRNKVNAVKFWMDISFVEVPSSLWDYKTCNTPR